MSFIQKLKKCKFYLHIIFNCIERRQNQRRVTTTRLSLASSSASPKKARKLAFQDPTKSGFQSSNLFPKPEKKSMTRNISLGSIKRIDNEEDNKDIDGKL